MEDKVPKHLPIEIKIRNADKVKNLNNEDWVRDLEIEVKNKSNKPIYFLPEVKSPKGNNIGFPLRYGRIEFVKFDTPVISEDVPILPSEVYVFKLEENQIRGWRRFAAEKHVLRGGPRKLQILFAVLNFGDGTGFDTTEGVHINIHEEQTANASCVEQKTAEIFWGTHPFNIQLQLYRQSTSRFFFAY
ncbi:MAG: hypothetical protein ACRD9R_11615 [Pyrinomonadaceae bacterium]